MSPLFFMIESQKNPKIKDLIQLKKASKRKKKGLYLIDGEKALCEALAAGVDFHEVYYTCHVKVLPWFENLQQSLGERACFEVSKDVFSKISYGDLDRGALALCPIPEKKISSPSLKGNLFAVLDCVEKPGNIGAVFRTCDALGVDRLFLSDPKTDRYNPNVIRSSLGACFHVPCESWNGEKLLSSFYDEEVQVFALDPEGDISLFECDFTKPSAIVAGAEHDGLSSFWRDQGVHQVSIPMVGKMDSLNVSVAISCALFESFRQQHSVG